MSTGIVRPIPLENLIVNQHNPRHAPQTSQREAIFALVRHRTEANKLANLAEDIADRGLNPSELLLVAESTTSGMYDVLEGNRRVAAMKLALSPSLVDSAGMSNGLARRFKGLQNATFPATIACCVLNEEDAKHWINLKHTGENDGVGVVNWDGPATHRFRGSTPALQVLDIVASSHFLDSETKAKLPKIAITNIERILVTTDARKELGVDLKSGKVSIIGNEDEVIARLSMIVADIAHRVKKVTDLDTKEQRIAYAKEVVTRPIPHIASATGAKGTAHSGASTTKGTTSATAYKKNPQRNTLIPRNLKIPISQSRINQMYDELQTLDLSKYVNCCAVMLRVFLELSIDEFAKRKKIDLTTPVKTTKSSSATIATPVSKRDMSLREKVKAVFDFMDTNATCTRSELHGIKTLHSNRNHVLSVDTLNAYVHNQNYNPNPTDLKANWDSIEVFVQRLWTT